MRLRAERIKSDNLRKLSWLCLNLKKEKRSSAGGIAKNGLVMVGVKKKKNH